MLFFIIRTSATNAAGINEPVGFSRKINANSRIRSDNRRISTKISLRKKIGCCQESNAWPFNWCGFKDWKSWSLKLYKQKCTLDSSRGFDRWLGVNHTLGFCWRSKQGPTLFLINRKSIHLRACLLRSPKLAFGCKIRFIYDCRFISDGSKKNPPTLACIIGALPS